MSTCSLWFVCTKSCLWFGFVISWWNPWRRRSTFKKKLSGKFMTSHDLKTFQVRWRIPSETLFFGPRPYENPNKLPLTFATSNCSYTGDDPLKWRYVCVTVPFTVSLKTRTAEETGVWTYLKIYSVTIPHRINVWYIYLHLVDTNRPHVGKYTIHGSYGSWSNMKLKYPQNKPTHGFFQYDFTFPFWWDMWNRFLEGNPRQETESKDWNCTIRIL